jgi:hypothetical protein
MPSVGSRRLYLGRDFDEEEWTPALAPLGSLKGGRPPISCPEPDDIIGQPGS